MSAPDQYALGRRRRAEPVPEAARIASRDGDSDCVRRNAPSRDIDVRDYAVHAGMVCRERSAEIDEDAFLQDSHRRIAVQQEHRIAVALIKQGCDIVQIGDRGTVAVAQDQPHTRSSMQHRDIQPIAREGQ